MLRLALAGRLTLAQVPEPPPPAAAIEWRAPPACPDRAALIRGVEARLGRALRPGELALGGVVERHEAPSRYRLTLRLGLGAHRERRDLDAETCDALVDATAVLAALLVADGPRPPTRPAIVPPSPAPPRPAPPAPRRVPRRSRPGDAAPR